MLPDETRTFLSRLAGREPRDESLWLEALTHGSTGQPRNYERLEFLGDRVLGLVVAHMLYGAFPGESEGELSRRLAALVRKETAKFRAVVVEAGIQPQ